MNNRRGFRQFVGPAALIYTLLFVAPSLFSVFLSFQNWGGLGTDMKFVGLDNYLQLITNDVFQRSFINTLVLAVAGGLLTFIAAFASMVVLRETKGRKFIRSVVYLPNIISPIAIGAALSFVFDSKGALNSILNSIGIGSVTWLGPDMIFKCIIVGLAWSSAGFYVLLLMSAADQISPDLYEEARLAGASKWRQFRVITLPLTWDVFATAAVLWVIGSLKIFEIVIAFSGTVSGSVPIEARTVAVTQFYQMSISSGLPALGLASAIGVLLVILSGILLGLTRVVTKRESFEL